MGDKENIFSKRMKNAGIVAAVLLSTSIFMSIVTVLWDLQEFVYSSLLYILLDTDRVTGDQEFLHQKASIVSHQPPSTKPR